MPGGGTPGEDRSGAVVGAGLENASGLIDPGSGAGKKFEGGEVDYSGEPG